MDCTDQQILPRKADPVEGSLDNDRGLAPVRVRRRGRGLLGKEDPGAGLAHDGRRVGVARPLHKRLVLGGDLSLHPAQHGDLEEG